MKKTDIIKLLGMLSAAYPNMKAVTNTMVDIWYDCLKDISVKDGLIATKKHILNSPFPPTIADIRGPKTSKRTGFHNFKQRSDRYSAEQLEQIARKKREEHFLRLKEKNKMLSLEDKSKEG